MNTWIARTKLGLTVAVLVAGTACAVSTVATNGSVTTNGSGGPTGTTTAPAPFRCPAVAATGTSERSARPAGSTLQVVTTVAPITSIVANVAGDRAQVTGIIPEGEDSHTFEPKPSAAKVLATADVVFVNGLQLEDPTKDLATTNLQPGGQIVELGTRTIRPDQYLYDFSFPKDGGKPNPHLWTNPPMARCYATITAAVLSEADPANAGTYAANAARFEAKVDALDTAMQAASAAMSPQQRELLTYHDAYAYFAEHYDWKVIGAIQVSSFEDPTPKEVADLIDQVEAEHVPAIFGSEVFPSPVLEQISAETGVRYIDALRDDDLPGSPGDADHSYLGLMRYDFVTMVTNLGGDASGLQRVDTSDVTPDRATYPQ